MPLAGSWLRIWIYLGFAYGWSRAARPRFDTSTDMGLVLVPADAEVDSVIFRLRATDQDADFPLVFEITATITPVVRIENLPCTLYNKVCQANVILTRRLIPGRLHDFAVRVRDSKGDTNSMQATISVTNATTPRDQIFPHIPSLIMVPENTKPGKELDYLLVRANPWSGKPVYIELWQPKELFTIRQRQTPTQTRGVITLIGELDFETQSMYTLTMYATDPYTEPGKDTRNIAGLNAVVVVQDVQDVPPIFTLAPPLTKINNSVQPGDIVLRVHAEDGDKGVPREIVYGLVSEGNPFTPFFNISETSGEITLARPLEELTQITHVGAPVVLSVVAEEIRRSTDEPPTQATVVEVGFLLGEPGNSPPYFESDNYMALIDENPEPGTVIVFPEQYSAKVRDEDIGKAGVFALKLENNNGTFEISPAVAERVADFIITVRDNSLIDYEVFKSLIFKIIAQEVGPATNLSATVPVTIFLRDINDNSPVFDEESYEVTLSENVTAGTRVIQVHATDKDTGPFGRIQYTRIIGDGSEAFTLDPDSGAITVSMGSSLDREATPRLQLSVEARDEDGKGNRGTAPLIINLLDVNDNAPIFEKDVYEFMLNADLTNFTTQAIIKAIDADSEPPNNEVRYELVHGNYENKFYLNEVTGELILRSPITKIRRKKQSVYENLGKKLRKEFVQVEDIFRELVTNDTIKKNVTKWAEDAHNRSTLIHQIKEIVKSRRKRANNDPLYTLTARAYDLGVPHMSSITQIRVIRAAFMEARIVMFVVPGEHPDPTRTAETLSTITGGRVIIQEIRPYVAQNQSSTANMPAGKKSIVLARVEQNGPDTPLVDIEKIRETLAANGVGIIGTTETVTDIINTSKSTNSGGINNNSSIKTVIEDEAIIYKAENKLLFWLLLILGLLMLAAIITLILCCICPSCPFYMAPRKRRVHSSEALITKPNGRPKRHIRRTHATAIDGRLTEKKQAWSADPTRRNWQFNRRNTRTLGLASLPGDVAYVSGQRDDMNVHTLRLRDGPMTEREERDAIYAEDIEAQRIRGYEMADADSLQRHELERGSEAHRHSYRYTEADDEDEKLVREQHFFREGNAEVLRLVTRGPGEDSQHHRATLVVDGKEILLRRFIEDQELRHDIAMQDIEAARSMESHKRSKEAIAQQQGIILLPERLEIGHGPHVEKLDADVSRLVLDQRDYDDSNKIEQKESQMRQEQLRQETQLRQESVVPGLVTGGVSGTLDSATLGIKDQTKSYSYHDMELARQNALLTRLLLERDSKAVGVAMDSTSYLETQSLPGQVAIATQTDRTAGTQTERHVRSRSDNDESEDESRQKKKLKSKKRHVEVDSKRRTLWMKSPIEEEDSPGFDKRLSVLRKKVKEVKDGRKGSLEPDVLREISDSLDGAEETEPTKKVYRRSTEETNVRYKMLAEDESASSAELSKRKSSRMFSDQSRSTDDRRRDVTESTSSPEVKAKVKRSIRTKTDQKSPKKEDKRSTLKKSDSSTEPSFRILEKEITLLTKKLSKLGEKKGQESTGSESTAQDKMKSVKKDSRKGADQVSSKKVEETTARRLKSSTEPSTSKSSVPEDTSTHRKETFLSKARQKLKYQQAAAASTASSELEDGSDKSKKLISGTIQDSSKQKQSVAHGRLKRQAHVEKESKKSSTTSEDVDKHKTSSSKEMSNEDQKKDKPTKLVSRVKHLASIGRKEHVSEDFNTSSGKAETKKSIIARRETEKKTSTDTSENASDHTTQRKMKKVSEKSTAKSDDSRSGIKHVETVVKREELDKKMKDVERKKESLKKSPTSVFDDVKDVLNGAVSKSVMSVNEVLKNVIHVEEKSEAVQESDLKMTESKSELMVEEPTHQTTETEQKDPSPRHSKQESEKHDAEEIEKNEQTEAKGPELFAEDDKKEKSESMTSEPHTSELVDSKIESKKESDVPEEKIKDTSEEQSSSVQSTSAEILSPAKKVDEVMHKLIDEITQEQPAEILSDVPSAEEKVQVPPEAGEQINGDKMVLKEIPTESEKHEESIKDDKMATKVEENLSKEESGPSATKPETEEISLAPEESDTRKDEADHDKVDDTITQSQDELKNTTDTIMKAGTSTSPKPPAPEEEKKSPESPSEKISTFVESKHEEVPETIDKTLTHTEEPPDKTDIKTEDKQTSEEAAKIVEQKRDKDEEHKQETDSKIPEISKEEDVTKNVQDEHADASEETEEKEEQKESEEVKSEDKEELIGKEETEIPIQPAMQYLDVSTPIFTSAIDTLGDSDDSDTSSDISRKTTLTAGPYQTPRHRARNSSEVEYIQSEKILDKDDADENLMLEVPAASKEAFDTKIKSEEPVKSVAEDDVPKEIDDRKTGSAGTGEKSDRKSKTLSLSGKVSPRVTERTSIRPEIEGPRMSKIKEDQSAVKTSEVKDKPAFRLKEDQRIPKASEGKDKATSGLKDDQKALICVIDSSVPDTSAHKHAQIDDKPKKQKHPQEKLRISPTRKEKKAPSEEISKERIVSGQKSDTIHHSRRAQKATDAEEAGRKEDEQSKELKKKSEDRQKISVPTKSKAEKEKKSVAGEKPGVEIDVSKTRSKYMAWYKQKREEMEKKRLEMKEDEEQLPRWLRRSLGYRKANQDTKKKQDSKSPEMTPRTRRKIKPLVNVESEQLKAIVRQGRKLRKAEGGGNEDPPVQIFATTPPAAPPPEQKHHLLQHSEYKFERMPPPFYLHPPPPAPHPSPQMSPVHDDPRRSEYRRPEDDFDSGIVMSLQGGTRLRHQQLLEKKSVFDIAYSEAAPSQLRSDSTTPPS